MLLEASLAFQQTISGNKSYKEALALTRQFSEGNVWIIGGTVFRSIAQAWYGTSSENSDFDFIVEKLLLINNLDGWNIGCTRFGSPRLKKADLLVDIVPLNDMVNIKRKDLAPTIDNYLATVPLTIQSIVYDITTKKIMGAVGINALKTRTVGINDSSTAIEYASSLGLSVNDLILEKASSLGFTPQLMNE